MAITAADIITNVLDRLNEVSADPTFWTREELLDKLNEAYNEENLISGRYTSERTQELVSSIIFGIPVGAVAVMSMEISNRPLEKSAIEDSDRGKVNWQKDKGIPREWGAVGLTKLFTDRCVIASGTNVTIVTLDDVGIVEEDTVFEDAEYALTLEDYVFSIARLKEGGAEFQQGLEFYDRFMLRAGLQGQRSMSQQYALWGATPDADTGLGYSTAGRS